MPPFTTDPALSAHRGALLHFDGDPLRGIRHDYFADGLLLIHAGRVLEAGAAAALLPQLPADCPVFHHENALILPGLVDTHVHYPQLEVIGAQCGQLLEWLERRVFPAELRYADAHYAVTRAEQFLQAMLAAGTTTAAVFSTVHSEAAEVLFSACAARGLRMLTGKVLMDENAPDGLRDGPDLGEAETRTLIERWHGRDRLSYAISPRYAGSCSREQLALAGRLLAEYPGVRLHTHLAENLDELVLVRDRFPEAASYLDIYAAAGLLGPQSLFAHCIHLDDHSWQRLADNGSAALHCPSANLFLGSGLFALETADRQGVPVGLGSDVGAGTSLSLLRTLGAAWQVQQLRGAALDPLRAFYMATLGGARALGLDHVIGNFNPGMEADFVVLDLDAPPLPPGRVAACSTLRDTLGVLAALGDERCVRSTWIAGRCSYEATPAAGRGG